MNLFLISFLLIHTSLASTLLTSDLFTSFNGYYSQSNHPVESTSTTTCSGQTWLTFAPTIFKQYTLTIPSGEPVLQLEIQFSIINLTPDSSMVIFLNNTAKATLTYSKLSSSPLTSNCGGSSNAYVYNATIFQNMTPGTRSLELMLSPTIGSPYTTVFGVRGVAFTSLGAYEVAHPGVIDWAEGHSDWVTYNGLVQSNQCNIGLGRISLSNYLYRYVNLYLPSTYTSFGVNYRVYAMNNVALDTSGLFLGFADETFSLISRTLDKDLVNIGKENPCTGEMSEAKYVGSSTTIGQGSNALDTKLVLLSEIGNNYYYVTRFEIFGVTEEYAKTTPLPFGFKNFNDHGFIQQDRQMALKLQYYAVEYLAIPYRQAIYKTFYLAPKKAGLVLSAEFLTKISDRDFAALDIFINGRKLVTYSGINEFSIYTQGIYICKAAFFVQVNAGSRYALTIAIKDSSPDSMKSYTAPYSMYGLKNLSIQEVDEDFLSQPGVALSGVKVKWDALSSINHPTSNTNVPTNTLNITNTSNNSSNSYNNTIKGNSTDSTTILVSTSQVLVFPLWGYIIVILGFFIALFVVLWIFIKRRTKRLRNVLVFPMSMARSVDSSLQVISVNAMPKVETQIIDPNRQIVLRRFTSLQNTSLNHSMQNSSLSDLEADLSVQLQYISSILDSRLRA